MKAWLVGVKYVFFDEVSMLSCHDLFCLSHQMIQMTGVFDSPFGGLNMILAGDLAQLPLVIGREYSSLYSLTIRVQSNIHMSTARGFNQKGSLTPSDNSSDSTGEYKAEDTEQ